MSVKLLPPPTSARDYWVLGHTQKQGGSVLQAGARSILIPSAITRALSTTAGRLGARTMMFMGVTPTLLNYAAFRPYAMMEAVRRVLPEHLSQPLIVDPAAGYSPQFIWLAKEMPHAHFIEIDRAEVIRDKRQRLRHFRLPENFEMIEAGLDETALPEVLRGRYVNVMIALAAYVKPIEFTGLLRALRHVMAPDGHVVSAIPYLPGVEDLARDSALFRRLAGEPRGMVKSENTIRFTFQQAGYRDVRIHHMPEMARALEKPLPADLEVIATARV